MIYWKRYLRSANVYRQAIKKGIMLLKAHRGTSLYPMEKGVFLGMVYPNRKIALFLYIHVVPLICFL